MQLGRGGRERAREDALLLLRVVTVHGPVELAKGSWALFVRGRGRVLLPLQSGSTGTAGPARVQTISEREKESSVRVVGVVVVVVVWQATEDEECGAQFMS